MAEARVEAVAPPAGRARLGLAALASASFVYVTAETLPVGLLPQLSAGLHVRPGRWGCWSRRTRPSPACPPSR